MSVSGISQKNVNERRGKRKLEKLTIRIRLGVRARKQHTRRADPATDVDHYTTARDAQSKPAVRMSVSRSFERKKQRKEGI
jgi:hypothetical protein